MPQNREVDNFVQPDYRYGVDQEPLDSRKLKNKGFGDKKQIWNDIPYYADQSWLITATAINGWTVDIAWYNWPTDTLWPTEIVAYWAINGGIAATWMPNITFWVNKWTYYKVTSTIWLYIAYFTPLH